LERAWIRVRRLELRPKGIAHAVVDDQIIARAGEELGERDLVVLVGLEAELAAMMPVRQDALVQLTDAERLRQILREPGADGAHQLAVHPIDIVHHERGLRQRFSAQTDTPYSTPSRPGVPPGLPSGLASFVDQLVARCLFRSQF